MLVDRDQKLLTIRIIVGPVFTPGFLSQTIRNQILDGDRHVILDLRHVEIVHSPILGELVQAYIHLQKRDVTMEVTGLSDSNRRLFRYTRLDELLAVHEPE